MRLRGLGGGEEKDGTEEEGIFVAVVRSYGRESKVLEGVLADLKSIATSF